MTDLTHHNTLAVPARARSLTEIHSVTDLETWALAHGSSAFVVVGGGSNIVLASSIIDTPILLNRIAGISWKEDGDTVLVTAGAGEPWHGFVERMLDAGFHGLENLALIPGTVGASPIQNIGAYGVEMKDCFHSLRAWNADTRTIESLGAAECAFGYRDSCFKTPAYARHVVVDVTFRLTKTFQAHLAYGDLQARLAAQGITEPCAREVFEVVCETRRSKLPDPLTTPNAGSFFKNPVVDPGVAQRLRERFPGLPVYAAVDGMCKLAAGWLIDQAGWRGRRVGLVGVHDRQALVLVNHGGTGAEVLALAHAIQADIRERYGIDLVMEPVQIQ